MQPIMNPIRKMALTAILLSCAVVLRGQTVIDLSAYIDEETTALLGENNAVALKNKISKIITRNGMADAEGIFVVAPTLTVTDDGTVDTGMTKLRVLRADLTLSVRNNADNTVFGSQTVALQANGKSDEACMRSLVNKVNVNDVRFAKLIRDVQKDIADYYTRQMPKIMTKVHSLVAQEAYADALTVLSMIPESVDEYATVADLQVQVYNKMLEREVTQAVAEADIKVRQGDIDGALTLCRSCNPLSPNYDQVVKFLRKLDADAAAAEAAAQEQEQRRLDAEMQRNQLVRQQAVVEGQALKAERAETSRKKGISMGRWFLNLLTSK